MNFEAQSIQDEDFYVKDNLSNLKPKSILLIRLFVTKVWVFLITFS